MIRNVKALGLAVVSVLAMSAVIASAAQAANFTAAEYLAQGTATSSNDVFRAFGQPVICTENNFTGELTAASETLTIHPTYKNCKFGGVFPFVVNFTSCDYVFRIGTQISANTFNAKVNLKCDEDDSVDITIFPSVVAEEENKPICHINVAEQGPLTGTEFHYTNEANGTLTISGKVENITATQVRTSASCPTATVDNAATYTIQPGGINVSATHEGAPVAVDVG